MDLDLRRKDTSMLSFLNRAIDTHEKKIRNAKLSNNTKEELKHSAVIKALYHTTNLLRNTKDRKKVLAELEQLRISYRSDIKIFRKQDDRQKEAVCSAIIRALNSVIDKYKKVYKF